jgi:hypothetical protein
MRIFTALSHISHQYRMMRAGHEWEMLESNVRRWNSDVRPFPENCRMVPAFESGRYDAAVLLFDVQCLDASLGKGRQFHDLLDAIDCPVIVVVNSMPNWPEKWEAGYPDSWQYPEGTQDKEAYRLEALRSKARGLLRRADRVLMNSETAAAAWGFGGPLRHGIPAEDYPPTSPKEPRVVSCVVPGGLGESYGAPLLAETSQRLAQDYGPSVANIGSDWKIDDHPRLPEIGGWGAYKDYLGRSLLFFNPAKASPNPRARTEAMLSGCCVLTTGNQGEEDLFSLDTRRAWTGDPKSYLEAVESVLDSDLGSVTGFVVPESPAAIAALADLLLHRRYADAVRIGRNGSRAAAAYYSWPDYRDNLNRILTEVTS